MSTGRFESTPEQLASQAMFPTSHWRRAHDLLKHREEWPLIAAWAVEHGVDPLHLPEIVEILSGVSTEEDNE